jgi:twitching motility protein PilI
LNRTIHLAENMLSVADALDVLADFDTRSRLAAQRLPEVAPVRDVWDGLVFSVAGVRVAAAMNEISEMLPHQERITRVPGAKPWVLGLANVRSSLLPVIDLQAFLGAKAVVPSKATRILVLRLRGLVVGLLVPSVQGMRHFSLKDQMTNARMKGALGAYVYEAFSIDGNVWPVFSMTALAADPAFRAAAL